MKIKKTLTFTLLLLMISSVGLAFLPNSVTDPAADLYNYDPIDLGVELRSAEYPIDSSGAIMASGADVSAAELPVLDEKLWLALDNYAGSYFFTYFIKVAEGDSAEVWIQENINWSDGDPRPNPVITLEQVEYILDQFENVIIPTDSAYFGTPDEHNGSYSLLVDWGYVPEGYYEDSDAKHVILLENVRDANYYNATYPNYIAGFFSSTMEAYFDRNIITIDVYNWEDRVGPDAARPFLYEGVVAHELQHLIHSDYNSGDDSFMNEGCSMYAEPLCGYGYAWGQMEEYLTKSDNSLTVWEDQGGLNVLADYGGAALWAIYLSDQFGDGFLAHFVQSGIGGIAGINAALADFGIDKEFDEVYHDWRIANLIHSDRPGHGKYNYKSIDISDIADGIIDTVISGDSYDWVSGTEFGTMGDALLPVYGAEYIQLTDWKKHGVKLLTFDGDDDVTIQGWEEIADGLWWSGMGDLLDRLLVGEVYVDAADPTLEMDTYWDIEDNWDFGFVQVSTDGGDTWVSLANGYTTDIYDPAAKSDIIDNLPGLTSWVTDYIHMEFDLSAYSGQDVLIGFRFMTDWNTHYYGWEVANVTVSGADVELANYYPEADFQVSIVFTKYIGKGRAIHTVWDLCVFDEQEIAFAILWSNWADEVVLVVSSISENGEVDYRFKLNKTPGRRCGNLWF